MEAFDKLGLDFATMLVPWIAILISISAAFWFKDFATNFNNVSRIELIDHDQYYTSFADVFGDTMQEHELEREKLHMFNDYGQQYDRQSLRKDFDIAYTKSKVYSYNGKKLN